MKQAKFIFFGLTMGLYFQLTGCTPITEVTPKTAQGNLRSEVTQPKNPQGDIVLSEVETYGVDPEFCHIPAVEGTYMLNRLAGCYTDDYDLIRFNNVPSGLTVTILDHGWCTDKYNNWAIAMTTVKQPTTTPGSNSNNPADWISFESIWTTEPTGAVISPGVMKQGRWQKGDSTSTPDFENTASCVIISRE